MMLALERKLADSLVNVFENGFRPWWVGTREMALKWRASSQLRFVSAPEGFSSEGGWWTDVSGVVSPLPALGREAAGRWTRPKSEVREGSGGTVSTSGGEWTAAMSRLHLRDRAMVKSIVFPAGVSAIGWRALYEFTVLESIVFSASCSVLGTESFRGCESLKAISLPADCKTTGVDAFCECESLESVTIPAGCMTISPGSFSWCTSLTSVKIPSSCTMVGNNAFGWCSLGEVVVPDGCQIGDYAFQYCVSLMTVIIGSGCTTIGVCAFRGCTALASVALPSTLKSIGGEAFENCRALRTIAVPKGCQVDECAFWGSKTRMAEL
jgi:hypothetical protein